MKDKHLIGDILSKTGFELEYKITNILEKNGWNTINNRYYLDNNTNIQREIDILAYKAISLPKLDIYYSLIISCKKSNMPWVFLTKSKIDCINYNYLNIAFENTSPLLSFFSINDKIENSLKASDFYEDINIQETVFAYQIIDLTNKKPANDKPIFESIITTINAMEYEKELIKYRKNKECIYFFNLLAIVDTDLYKTLYDEIQKDVTEIDSIFYYNRFIFNNRENEYKIHFIKKNVFEIKLKLYDKICKTVINVTKDIYNKYYSTFYLIDHGMQPYEDRIITTITSFINRLPIYYSEFKKFKKLNIKKCNFAYNIEEECLYIDLIPFPNNSLYFALNNSTHVTKVIKKRLFELFTYDGDFIFETVDYESPVVVLSHIYW